MSLGLTDAIVKLKDFHRLTALLFALQAMLIKGKLAVLHILLTLQQNVEQGGLQAWRASQNKFGWGSIKYRWG